MMQFDSKADLLAELNKEWESKLKSYLLGKLKTLGYEFKSDDEFLNFCEKRVTRVTNCNAPDKEFMYLDEIIRLVTIETTFEVKTTNYSTICAFTTVFNS